MLSFSNLYKIIFRNANQMINSFFKYSGPELENIRDIKTITVPRLYKVLVLFYFKLQSLGFLTDQVVKLSKPVKHLDRLISLSNGRFRTCCQVVKIFNNCVNSIILNMKLVVGNTFIEINILDNLTTSSQPLKP